jgi:CRP-like cAMP-binding protein
MSRPLSASPRNRLLALLPDDDLRRLQRHFKTVSLEPGQVLYHQGDRIRYVYFPNGGVICLATVLLEGAMVEAASVGTEGMAGSEAFFDEAPLSSCEAVARICYRGETAERIRVEDFRRELAARPAIARVTARYVQVLHSVSLRLMACNAHHQVEERCARWLLSVHDRTGGRDFKLSHELLATLLGVRRQSVTIVAGALRAAGFIEYVHGRVAIVDRKGLEAAACECYPVVRALYRRIDGRI